MAKILAVLDDDATQAKLLAIVREVNALPPQQQQMQKMGRLFPAVQEATAPVLAEYGFAKEQLMALGTPGIPKFYQRENRVPQMQGSQEDNRGHSS